MTSQPAPAATSLGPDRIFGPFDQDLAHRTAAQASTGPAQPSPLVIPATARDESPSYCFWPAALLSRP